MTYPPAGGQFPAPASAPYGHPPEPSPYGGPPQGTPYGLTATGGRPAVLTIVVVFLWVIAGLSVLGALASLGFSLLRYTSAGTIGLGVVNFLAALLVAAVAAVAAVWIPQGRDLGRVLGLVVAGYLAVESIASAMRRTILEFMTGWGLGEALSILVSLAVGAAAVVVFVQLLRGDVAAWFRATAEGPTPAGPIPGGPNPQGGPNPGGPYPQG